MIEHKPKSDPNGLAYRVLSCSCGWTPPSNVIDSGEAFRLHAKAEPLGPDVKDSTHPSQTTFTELELAIAKVVRRRMADGRCYSSFWRMFGTIPPVWISTELAFGKWRVAVFEQGLWRVAQWHSPVGASEEEALKGALAAFENAPGKHLELG